MVHPLFWASSPSPRCGFNEALSARIQPNVVTFTTLISAAAAGMVFNFV